MSIEVSDEDVEAVHELIGDIPSGWLSVTNEKLYKAIYAVMRRKDNHAAIGEAIERAVRELPEGWQLVIDIREGSSVAFLCSIHGVTVEYERNSDSLAGDINDAIEYAKRSDNVKTGN